MTLGRPLSSASFAIASPSPGGSERAWSLKRAADGRLELLVWAMRDAVPLAQALRWFAPMDRRVADRWFSAQLEPRPARSQRKPVTQSLIVRATSGPLAGALLRFVADPPLRAGGGMPFQVSGHYIDFLSQLAPLRQALGFIEHPRLGTWMLDIPTGLLDMDEAWMSIVGLDPSRRHGFTHADWVAMTNPEDVAGFDTPEQLEALRRGEVVQSVTRSRHAKGHWVWFLTCCRGALWSPSGEVLRIIGYDIDITEHRELLARTEDQRLLMQRILDVMPSGQVVVDLNGAITFCNPEAAEIFGMAADRLIGRSFISALPIEEGLENVRAGLASDVQLRDVPLVLRRPPEEGVDAAIRLHLGPVPAPGPRRHLRVHFTPVAAAGKTFVTLTDMTAHETARRNLEQAVEQARYIATHDLMTGLPDRYDFLRRLSEALAEAERRLTSLTVMMIDLDDFKAVNDGMGHEAGDQLLKSVAQRLQRGLPDRARLARFGGDEFVLLVPDCPPSEAALLADALGGRFETPLDFSRRNSQVTASIGIGVFPFDARSAEGLLRAADLAMYEAKSLGRGLIRRYSPDLSRRSERRIAVRHALQRALTQGGFQIVLQPKFALSQLTRPVGAEVLLRLNDPDLGSISPSEFIAVAETQDLIPAVDREVVWMVSDLRAAWRAAGIDLPLSINLSPLTLCGPGFADLMETLPRLAAQGGLMVEVTETALMGRLSELRETLLALRGQGVGIAIDDFGIGHSSLAYLQSLPIQELKIDRSFVAGLMGADAAPSNAIVRAILAMAEALGLETIAEGVETTEQANWLIEHGCLRAQGYLLGRPVSPEDFRRIYFAPGQPGPDAVTPLPPSPGPLGPARR